MDEHPGVKKQGFTNSKKMLLLPTITVLSKVALAYVVSFPCGN